MRLPFGLHEVAALNADETVLAGRRIVEEGEVGRRSGGGAMVHYVRLEQAVVPLGLSEAGQGKQNQSGDYRDLEPN